jgi:hypothetical protein
MEKTCSSETSLDFQRTTWRENSQERNLHQSTSLYLGVGKRAKQCRLLAKPFYCFVGIGYPRLQPSFYNGFLTQTSHNFAARLYVVWQRQYLLAAQRIVSGRRLQEHSGPHTEALRSVTVDATSVNVITQQSISVDTCCCNLGPVITRSCMSCPISWYSVFLEYSSLPLNSRIVDERWSGKYLEGGGRT